MGTGLKGPRSSARATQLARRLPHCVHALPLCALVHAATAGSRLNNTPTSRVVLEVEEGEEGGGVSALLLAEEPELAAGPLQERYAAGAARG